MKRFRINSTIFIALIAVTFAFNVWYLVGLYHSIRENVERDVMAAIADADIDDMIRRMESETTNYTPQMREAIEKGDSAFINTNSGSISANVNPENGEIVNRTITDNGDTVVAKSAVTKDISLANQLVQNISSSMHVKVDIIYEYNVAAMDSILARRLADRRIYPDFVAVEIVDSLGHVIRENPRLTDRHNYEVFRYCYNPETGYSYQAYLTPLTRHIFSQMRGVVITVALLMIFFAAAFVYLYRTVSKLRTIEEMKDDFVSNMTHELKTPIAIAYSANDALLNFDADENPEKRESYLRIAMKQLKSLSAMVESILAMSMERRKNLKLNSKPIELKPFIEEIAEVQRLRKDKEIAITIEGDSAVVAEADPKHLTSVLNNLIDNAIKYSGDSVEIHIGITPDGISVSDNGIGIPAKSLPHIFDKFYRVPHGNRQDVRGYGIGLYYVKSILEKMGWSIAVRSTVGKGSTFTIKFKGDE